MTHLKRLYQVLEIYQLMSTRKRAPFVSLTLMSRWRNILGLNVPVGSFLHKYPHVFHVFVHPFRKNTCCRVTKKMKELILLEGMVVRQQEMEAVKRVKKLLMMSVSGSLRLHALRMIRRELGLPEDFRDSILGKFSGDFKLVGLEVVELVDWDAELGLAEVEKWREREYTEKWLSEFEIKFAFPIGFPTGFKIERGFRERLKNWQRLSYTKPYERKEVVRVRTCGGIERYEKRAVAILHELLSLTVEKMVILPRHRFLSPFTLFTQRRWKKPTVSAQTRLEDRVRDPHFDKLMTHLKRLYQVLEIYQLMSTRKRAPFVSLTLMSRWRNILGLNVPVGSFLHKYPHVFHVFVHPFRKNTCCRVTKKMKELILLEGMVVRQQEMEAVKRVKKLLMMSVSGSLRLHALRMIRRELGLPEDFRDSILGKFSGDFKLVGLEVVELVDWDAELGLAEVEKWREREYTEKWLSEFEIKFAFPIGFPTGFKIERGFRERLKNWQRLSYTKPYERKEVVRVRTCGGIERYEKRAVAILHELLSLTVEKMVEVDQLAHFRRDLGIEVNVRELLLRHPGIFYISTKGKTLTVFLREAYRKGGLIEPNPMYEARRNILNLVLLGCRKTRTLLAGDEAKEESNVVVCEVNEEGERQGDWVIPFLENCEESRSP
ncbi:hypothetical protein DEO72_LG6g1819 [Vigna unguiculata]|uniref:PORR domain-containing protein n=1 Tax=Vigna unguiculata TaxID=3917 RepID=A0A4D6M6U8_VIGUN|nr:hypothetical protein DEO72_LG6g1819 [Vigna unguiculata]